MKFDIYHKSGKKSSKKATLNDEVFGVSPNDHCVYLAVNSEMAAIRQGTHSSKTRSEVSGSGVKPWRQKGTGRARAGTIRSPLWRSGGVTFAAKPRDFSQKVNRKMYRKAMCAILSEQTRQGSLFVTEEIKLEDHKTKTMLAALKPHQWDGVVFVVDQIDENVFLASRNIPKVHVIDVRDLNPLLLYHAPRVVLTKEVVKTLEEQLS